jgi:hypothetical protein
MMRKKRNKENGKRKKKQEIIRNGSTKDEFQFT